MLRFLIITTIYLSLLSCQTAVVQTGNVALGYSNYPLNITPGLKLKLNKAIVIPGETASLHIQDGEPKPQQLNPVENYRPYCVIEVRNRLAATQTIKPDIFTITRVFLNEEFVSLLPKIASLTMTASYPGLYLGAGGVTAVSYVTEIYLESDTQPDVVRLSCKQWDDPMVGGHLTLQEIKLALGELITILPETAEN
ncbi:MAG: hypothetical protein ACC635_01605 [Acidiferrobacterales bacterium]